MSRGASSTTLVASRRMRPAVSQSWVIATRSVGFATPSSDEVSTHLKPLGLRRWRCLSRVSVQRSSWSRLHDRVVSQPTMRGTARTRASCKGETEFGSTPHRAGAATGNQAPAPPMTITWAMTMTRIVVVMPASSPRPRVAAQAAGTASPPDNKRMVKRRPRPRMAASSGEPKPTRDRPRGEVSPT